MVVSEKNGYCSQQMLLDPDTGERHYYRTSPNQAGGALAFGGPYAGWLGPTLIELWRDDLVRTIQYGDLPSPPKPNARHTGCTFTDIALADEQFATVEHCDDQGPNARVVINWATPDSAPDKPDDQDVFKHDPRADIDTGSPAARIVGITSDRVAVLVSGPEPAVVVYDDKGNETSRTKVDIPAGMIVAADRLTASGGTFPTPAVQDGTDRYSLIGDRLIAVGSETIEVEVPPSTGTSTSAITEAQPPTPGLLGSTTAQSSAPPETIAVKNLSVRWTKDGARRTACADRRPAADARRRRAGRLRAANGNSGHRAPDDPGRPPAGHRTGRCGSSRPDDHRDPRRSGRGPCRPNPERTGPGRTGPGEHSRGRCRMIAARLEQLTPNSAARTTMPSSVGPLAALDAGSADAAATVLLLPGYTGSKEDFAPILDPLADNGYRAIAIDLPGQFESSGPLDEADYSPLALGAVCAEVVRDLAQHSPVVLLGHSFGGLVARGAVLAGAPIAGLVLLCSGPGALSDGARHDALLAAEPMLRLHGKELVYDNAVAGARAARKVVPPEVAELLRRRFIASTEVGLLGMGASAAGRTRPCRRAAGGAGRSSHAGRRHRRTRRRRLDPARPGRDGASARHRARHRGAVRALAGCGESRWAARGAAAAAAVVASSMLRTR